MLTDDYTLLDFAGCLINANGGSLLGLRKLIFLLFLSQYEKDDKDGSIIKYLYDSEPVARTEFSFWAITPFNVEIYDILHNFEVVSGPNTTLIISHNNEYCNKLPNPVRIRIEEVLYKYVDMDAEKLREIALDALGAPSEEVLRRYDGYLVDDYIEESGLAHKTVDLKYSRL